MGVSWVIEVVCVQEVDIVDADAGVVELPPLGRYVECFKPGWIYVLVDCFCLIVDGKGRRVGFFDGTLGGLLSVEYFPGRFNVVTEGVMNHYPCWEIFSGGVPRLEGGEGVALSEAELMPWGLDVVWFFCRGVLEWEWGAVKYDMVAPFVLRNLEYGLECHRPHYPIFF